MDADAETETGAGTGTGTGYESGSFGPANDKFFFRSFFVLKGKTKGWYGR